MPTAEGIFGKVGGDPLYASEANRLGRTFQTIFTGSSAGIGSSTALATA